MLLTDGYLAALNSATKYPSIPTYHKLGDKGRLTEELNVDFGVGALVHSTEKIDGTNVRIIIAPDEDWFIGSREHILYAKGDRIGDPAQGIVAAFRRAFRSTEDIGHRMRAKIHADSDFIVLYGELFGGKIGKAGPLYRPDGSTDFRLFDCALIPVKRMYEPLDDNAVWRDAGKQLFLPRSDLAGFADAAQFELVPNLSDDDPLPQSLQETFEWLTFNLPSQVGVNPNGQTDEATTKSEGIVVRSLEPTQPRKIAKIRFEDYERTLGIRG
jgi:hypothetical protein